MPKNWVEFSLDAIPMRFFRPFLGTLIAVLAGWFAGVIGVAIIAFSGIGGAQRDAALEGTLVIALYMWLFIIPVWLVALIPLYLFVPPSSLLWRPFICTGCGAVAGLAIGGLLSIGDMGVSILAAIVGGATCLIGVLTRTRFHPNHLTHRSSEPLAAPALRSAL